MAEKTRTPQGPERFLFKSAGIALWGYTLMLFIMLLPAIALKMNPGTAEAGAEALKTQSLITFSPLFMTIALGVTALFFAVLQNKYFVASAIAEGKNAGKEDLKRMLIPVLRYKEILRLAGDKPLIKPMIVCSVLFWISLLVFGLLSPFPFYFLLAAILLFYASVQRSSGKRMGKVLRGWTFVLLIVFLLSSVDGLRALKAPETVADPSIPRDRKELAALLGCDSVDRDFAALTKKYMSENHVCDKLNDARFYYAVPARFRLEANKIISNEQTKKTFSELEKALDAGKYFTHDFTSAPYLWYQTGYGQFDRIVCRLLSAKILHALEKGDRAEVMKNFRRLTVFQKNVQRGNFSTGLVTVFHLELNRAFLVGTMLGRGILTDKDLQEISSYNKNREQELYKVLMTSLRSEALFERELIDDMMKVYPWIQSSEASDGKLFKSKVMQFLLRGNNAFPPNTWNAVIHRKIRSESTAKFNAMLKKYADSKKFSEDEKKLTGTYFVMLNYKAQNAGIAGLYHAITFVRMTDVALNVEKFRRANKRLPKTLEELKVPVPVDAVSGKKIAYTASGFEVQTYPGPGKTDRMKLDGWQLYGSIRDYINLSVPTTWPVPAPREISR
jgi:hypothetical protein